MPRWNNALQSSDELRRLKREAILREAGRAFGARGFHKTSLDDLARVLHVSKGTLYNYVKDKQEILWEFHLMAVDIANRALAAARDAGGTGANQLRVAIFQYIQFLMEELGACTAIMEIDAMRSADRIKAIKQRDSFQRQFVDMVTLGIEDGSIRDVDPRLAIFTIFGAVNWLPKWYSPDGRLSAVEIAEQMTDVLLNGLTNAAAPCAAHGQLPVADNRARRVRGNRPAPGLS